MTIHRSLVVTLFALLAFMSNGLVIKTPTIQRTSTALSAAASPNKQSSSFAPLMTGRPVDKGSILVKAASTAAVVVLTSPLVALAVEEDYEYGAVNAPIGLAWGVGVLAILTALLPIALRGGEEAFEEMKDRDSESWGTGGKDTLNKRK